MSSFSDLPFDDLPDDIYKFLEENSIDAENNYDSSNDLVECEHSFWNLILNLSQGTLQCAACGLEWDAAEDPSQTMARLWHSTAVELARTGERVLMLEKAVSNNLDIRQCEGCGSWRKTQNIISLGRYYACPRHVGDVVENYTGKDRERAASKALAYADKNNLHIATDIERRALWERMICTSDSIATAAGDSLGQKSVDFALERPLILDDMVASALGVEKDQNLHKLSYIVASKVDTEPPETRLGAIFMLTLLSESLKLHGTPNIEYAAAAVVENSIPLTDIVRIATALDLCGQGMLDGTTFDGDMAIEALQLVARRSSECLLRIFRG